MIIIIIIIIMGIIMVMVISKGGLQKTIHLSVMKIVIMILIINRNAIRL